MWRCCLCLLLERYCFLFGRYSLLILERHISRTRRIPPTTIVLLSLSLCEVGPCLVDRSHLPASLSLSEEEEEEEEGDDDVFIWRVERESPSSRSPLRRGGGGGGASSSLLSLCVESSLSLSLSLSPAADERSEAPCHDLYNTSHEVRKRRFHSAIYGLFSFCWCNYGAF